MSLPIATYRPIVTFHIGFLLRLARLDKPKAGDSIICPVGQSLSDIFRDVIASNDRGFAPPFDDLIQRPDHAQRWQRYILFDATRMTGKPGIGTGAVSVGLVSLLSRSATY